MSYSKAYRQRYIDMADRYRNGLPVTRMIEIIGPDEKGKTPDRAGVSRWLKASGIRLDVHATAGFARSYKRRYVDAVNENPGAQALDLIDAIGPDDFGRTPQESTVHEWLRTAGLITAGYSDAYRAKIIENARDAKGYTTLARITSEVGPDARGKTPNVQAVARWLRAADIRIGVSRWTLDEWAEIESMLSGGISANETSRRFRKKYGKAPNADTIRKQFPEFSAKPMKAVDMPEKDGDSWQAAWDAAEGLDGAAWADAVMKAWLPDSSIVASECDVRAVPSGWRRRAA